ncbi:sporulation membrane protein YtrI [Gracilibacillus sp. YIM 98692]|uniref:sporulation membrane protein YtrI n=1 Tax=Gracilibacillus sp. YIM 98692 TaxID=2663532 RepID=UPI0013D52FD7|nr:sporulation membrane protein YtrI [Gracilibacillus sp. YIM 98692]
MHIPPYYKRPAWQRFLAGACIGGLIAYFVFLFMFGQLQEKWIEENLSLRLELQDLNKSYETLLKNHKALDERSKEGIQIESIDIEFTNLKEMRIENDRPMISQLEEEIRNEAHHAIGRNVNDLADSIELFIATIENKTITIDDFSYQATIRRIIVSETLSLSIQLSAAN